MGRDGDVKNWPRDPSPERLLRLGAVFEVEIRLKIITEAYLREMSATQFFHEFGGGSVSRISHNFKRLAEWGWLEHVRSEGPGGGRRGGVEHFFRAPELAIVDNETWALVPYPVRCAQSWATFERFGERVWQAVEGGTFDARGDRHFTRTPICVDQLGRRNVLAETDAAFWAVMREQEAAEVRLAKSGEEPILTTVGLCGFESPMRNGWEAGSELVEIQVPPIPLPLRLATIFRDYTSLRIVTEASLRPVSVPSFLAEIGGDSLHRIRRRFKALEENGWLRKVDMKSGGTRRGAIEWFYEATAPAVHRTRHWPEAGEAFRSSTSWAGFEKLAEEVKIAMRAGTLDSRPDRHLSWLLLRLDKRGWQNVTSIVNGLSEFTAQEANESQARLAKSGQEPNLMTVALAAFESPAELTKAP